VRLCECSKSNAEAKCRRMIADQASKAPAEAEKNSLCRREKPIFNLPAVPRTQSDANQPGQCARGRGRLCARLRRDAGGAARIQLGPTAAASSNTPQVVFARKKPNAGAAKISRAQREDDGCTAEESELIGSCSPCRWRVFRGF